MASNKENQLEDKDEDNLGIDNISKSELTESENKLKIIARSIHDIHNNTTRFLIIGNT